jgi:hypothetical protein
MKPSLVVPIALSSCMLAMASAHADQRCFEAAQAEARHIGPDYAVYYWPAQNRKAEPLRPVISSPTKFLYYFPRKQLDAKLAAITPEEARAPADAQNDPADPDLRKLTPPNGCPALFARARIAAPTAPGGGAGQGTGQGTGTESDANMAPPSVGDIISAYRRSTVADRNVPNTAASVAAEAARVLGQIVVDRASQAAYSMLGQKVKAWLGCERADRFAATCDLLGALRLQDLAMTPTLLGAALSRDTLALVDPKDDSAGKAVATARVVSVHPLFAADTGRAASEGASSARDVLDDAIRRAVIPLLSRGAHAITGRDGEAIAAAIVDRGLRFVEGKEQQLCQLPNRKRVLATAAVAFAACKVGSGCQVAQIASTIDATCAPSRLEEGQLARAASIAAHLQDAVTLQTNDENADGKGRIAAAADAAFDVACVLAHDDSARTYECEIDPTARAPKPLDEKEKVAMVRDVVRAAIDESGQALAAAFVRALVRVLPDAEARDPRKGLRVLATIAAYASTYTSGDGEGEGAQQQRTRLLESLTRDMTHRTERGGDAIFSLGGSLRAVAGTRIGRQAPGGRMDAFWGPVSLPLGFGFDYLLADHRMGFHAELGIIDLGNYLSWDQGGEVATPDVVDAFAPTLTLGWALGRELPIYLGVTGAYSPSFDFDADAPDSEQRRGAWSVGGAIGAYVPLFDFD